MKRMVDSGKMVVSWREMHCSAIARHATTIQVACSQCLRGRVVLEAYSVGKALYDAGVVQLLPGMPAALPFSRSPCALQISALDMTCEAVVTKMAYLLSLNVILPSKFDFNRRPPPPPQPSPAPSVSPFQLPPSDLRMAFRTSLRGELTGRLECMNVRRACS